MSEAENEPQTQLIDGRYRVLGPIADGGMATVYKAKDERLERVVAIKVMHTQLAQGPHRDQFVARFHREARSAAAISNPHIVQVYDSGTAGGRDYLVMEYVHGVNLRHEMNERGTFSVHETVRIISQTLDGLASAHRAGVVHRDIKPENILLNDRGRVQITDFGLAKAMSEATLSTTGMLLGTAAYLAPEMIENNIATPQGDLYSVGIMAWEMLAGQVPFTSDNPVTMVFKHVHEDVPALETVCPGIDPSISGFVSHLTARSVEDRPIDAAAALQELKALSSRIGVDGWQYRYVPQDEKIEAKAKGATSPLVGTAVPLADAAVSTAPSRVAHNEAGDTASYAANPASEAADYQTKVPAPPAPTTSTSAIRSNASQPNAPSAASSIYEPSNAPDTSSISSTSNGFATREPSSDTATSAAGTSPFGATQALPSNSTYERQSAPNAATQAINGRTLANDGTAAVNNPTITIGLMDAPTDEQVKDLAGDNPTTKTKSQKRSKLRKPVVITTIILALLAVLAACGIAWWYFLGPGSYYSVPKPEDLNCSENSVCRITDVKWKPYESTLKVAGVPYEVSEQFSDKVDKGSVISTDPGNVGGHVSKRTKATLKVVVSKGIRHVTIPKDILDPSSADGKKPMEALSQAGFTNIVHVESKDEYSEDLPAGAAKSVSPKPGTTIAHNSKVTLVLSKGPMPVSMPDVIGRSKDDAQAAFNDAKLKPNYTEAFNDSVPAGSIVSTSLKAGTQMHWGDKVDVVVSKGPETVTIPDVRGKNEGDAQKTLEALGLKVKISAPLGDLTHQVRFQSPDPGAQIRVRGNDGNPTVVTLTVV
ncbi:Stk1 family PASTA domain-containing Ser/Thr kinase [Bifidobacterium sp. ESL0732]|uniref:Stk1 family PASTA domain-containing Ser/Thr kinase n=1 Tax=Bifidobacterium sp. ESL0732 TaxID=2983222 RepID=UPI0023F6AD7B|nr:Stk1 family PASTA domain-containing Ser/Thr kinase [Bifidobacterium sp. ESL0732]WEV63508.1 PASTA domain-containing protein [Bifidobacterium sp. ESL0732]